MIRVQAENFRSYPDFDWTVPSGLILLDGENLDTGGSNMAGKSSIIDSVFWARYGWLPRWGGPKGGSPDSIIRRKNGESVGKAWVRLTEKIGSDEIVIERSRPSKLIVRKNGEELKGIDQDQLNELLGISPERYLISVYLSQNRSRSFYWMSDSERAEILSVVANLEGLDKGLEGAKEQKTIAQNELSKIIGVLSVLEPRLNELPALKEKIESEIAEANSRFLLAESRHLNLETEYAEFTPKLKNEKEILTKTKTDPLIAQIETARQETAVLDADLFGLNESLKKETVGIEPAFQLAVDEALNAIVNARNLEKECQKIISDNEALQRAAVQEASFAEAALSGSCNHCGQQLSEEKRQSKAIEHLKRGQDYQSKMKPVPAAPDISLLQKQYEEAAASLAERKAQLNSQPQAIQQQIRIVVERKKALEAKIRELQSQISLIENEIQSNTVESLRLKKQELDESKKVREAVEAELSKLNKSLIEHDKSAKKIQDEIDSAKNFLKQFDFKLNQALDLIDFFGPRGYRVVAFDGLVKRISDRAGELLSLMTDSLYSTRLDSVGQDSKGNQKLILKPIIIKGGVEVPKDDLSGGAETRVALAYDVAVAEAASSGQPLFLDEVLDGMDSIGKSEAMILLEEVSKTRPVIVIDHTSEFKAQFNQVIRVVYQNEESRLEV